MVALPTTISPTIAAIDKAYADGQEVRFQRRLSGSIIGKECERAIWYIFRWAREPERFDGRMIRLFETGHREEPRAMAALAMAGIEISDRDPDTGEQWEFTALDGHFVVKIDGRGTGFLEAPKAEHIVGIKTHNAKSFAQLLKHGIAVSKPEHIAQAQTEMHCSGIHRFFYYAKNKDTDELYSGPDLRIHYDAAQALALMVKAERIKNADRAPARISDDPNFFGCRFCPSSQVCHAGQFSLRNCRTCLNSAPIAGGVWHCARHDRVLSLPDQHSGCPDHLYLPSLVPGEQVDADEANQTVTYQLADGSTWIDGAHREGRPA